MPYHVRPRGARHELRVKHKLLPRPFYATFDDATAADTYGQQLVAMLDRGILPAELQTSGRVPGAAAADPSLLAIARDYLAHATHLTASDDALLASMADELGRLRRSTVTYRWAGEWVRQMKLQRRLAPGSIRKRVGVLARVMDWHLASGAGVDQAAGVNPLRLLPKGYSQYTEAERRELAKTEHTAPVDVVRDRRLASDEEARVLAVLAGHHRPDRERAWAPGGDAALALMFRVVVDTGLRLREAYRLRVDQVDLQRGVLRVEGSKGTRGQIRPRVVPLKLHLRRELASWCAGRVGLLWPYWDGSAETLDATTRRLSARFSSLFAYAQVVDFTEHDLRHEATCRWFELRDDAGRWVFADVEIGRIMGWKKLDMALRYASLRGEDLAARLG